ncbi:hypothetical protein AAC387_Pa10g2071 [Persea americana]
MVLRADLSCSPLRGNTIFYPQDHSWVPYPNIFRPFFRFLIPPSQPHRGKSSLINPTVPVLDYFAWGHKLLTIPTRTRPGFFIYDAKEKKWAEDWDFIEQFTDTYTPVPNGAGVEFKGIVFALSIDMNALVAYDLDAGGHLSVHWVLDELSEVFEGPPSLYLGQGFLTDLGGGRMCVLFSGMDDDRNWIVCVEVFRVDITTVGDRSNRPVVHREFLRSFKLQSWCVGKTP